MARESFIFYASFYDAIKEQPNALRLEIFDAVCEFSLNGNEPELTGVAKAIFTLIRPQIAANFARYEGGCKGGAPKGNQNARKKNLTTTIDEPNDNLNTTKKQPKNNLKQPNENDNVNDNDIFPPISPQSGEGDAKTVFFDTYPALKSKRTKDEGIDYGVLLDEFAKSATLRGMYSFAKVVGIYESIKAGHYRDKVDGTVAAANAKSARDKWYADKRAKAEAAADRYRAIVNGSERFKQIERALGNLNLEMAKAELYEPHRLPGLQEARADYLEERQELLAHLGVKEWQLEPQYECEKCNDSGYQADGRACDCYKEVAV
jgi:hypothetical protein